MAAERAIRSAQAPHYIEHLKLIRPYVTIISVGRDNSYGHPSGEALWLYREHSVGIPVVGLANQFIKVARTDEMGTIFLTMSDDPAARGWVWRNPDAQ